MAEESGQEASASRPGRPESMASARRVPGCGRTEEEPEATLLGRNSASIHCICEVDRASVCGIGVDIMFENSEHSPRRRRLLRISIGTTISVRAGRMLVVVVAVVVLAGKHHKDDIREGGVVGAKLVIRSDHREKSSVNRRRANVTR